MLLHKKEQRYKKLLALDNRRKELQQQKWRIKPVKLDKPIFNGYISELVLRADVSRRSDSAKIEELVNWLGQDKVYCRDKSFVRHKGRNKVLLRPTLRGVADPRFSYFPTEFRRNEALEKIAKFKKYLEYHKDSGWCVCEKHLFRTPHYIFRFPWMLEPKISEHYLTHYFPIDGDIESELAKIDDVLYVKDYILYGNYNWNGEDKSQYRLEKQKLFFSEQDVDNLDFVL